MTESPADFSVVICTYSDERWNELLRAVASVRAQSVRPRQCIVVVDNNPGLLERARAEFREFLVIGNAGPRGLSHARNSGLAAAQGRIVAFLDDDAAAAPDWLERLAAGYHDPRVIGVGGSIIPEWQFERPRWFPDEFDWVVGCTYRGLPARTAAVRNLIGANMSFRREVFVAVGGFRSEIGRVGTLPVGCEETEFCIRAQKRFPGSTFLYEPGARVAHAVPPNRATWSYFRRRSLGEGRSKAVVSRLVGPGDALSTERGYILRTLPRGVARGVSDAFRDDASGLARAGAIVAGLTITALGYAGGLLKRGYE